MMNAWRSCAELARYRISSHVRLDATALKWMENRRLTDILLRPYSFLLCLAKETGSSTERRKRMGSGDPPGLQNRRTASLMSSVRSTRTRFRQFVFMELQGLLRRSQTEK